MKPADTFSSPDVSSHHFIDKIEKEEPAKPAAEDPLLDEESAHPLKRTQSWVSGKKKQQKGNNINYINNNINIIINMPQ